MPSSFSLRVRVLRPQPKSFAASWRWPWVRLSAARISTRSNCGCAASSSGALPPEQVPLGPLAERRDPVGLAAALAMGAGELRRQVREVHLASRGEHREPPAQVHQLAHVARPVVRGEPRRAPPAASAFGSTPSSCAATRM